MRRLILFLIIIFCNSCGQSNQKKVIADYSLLEKSLQTLLQEREYFKLKIELQKIGAMLPSDKLHFYQAFVESAFNNSQNSILFSESILKKRDSLLQDSDKVNLMLLLRDNYFKTYQYKKAAQTGQDILKYYKNILGDRLHDVENTLLIHEGLKNIPPQQVSLKKVILKWAPNKLGLIELPIK